MIAIAAVACLLVAAAWVAWRRFPAVFSVDSVRQAVAIIRSTGAWGVLLSIALMTLHSFLPFPAEVIAIANGLVYGPVWGSAITWAGAMIGATFAFAIVRYWGRPFVHRMLTPRQQSQLATWSRRQGGAAILLSRLIPVIAFNFINYASALTDVSLWTFLWATGVGILPLTIALAVLGDRMLSGWTSAIGLLGALVLAAAIYVCRRVRDRRANRVDHADEY